MVISVCSWAVLGRDNKNWDNKTARTGGRVIMDREKWMDA